MATDKEIEAAAQRLFDRLCERCMGRGHMPHHATGTLVKTMPPPYRDDYFDDARAALTAAEQVRAGAPGADVASERKRCADILQAARHGVCDQDLRSLIGRITRGDPAPAIDD